MNVFGNVTIEHLKVPCIIGVNPHERLSLQHIYIDLKIEFDMSACIATDNLNDTIDYVKIAELCSEIAQKGQYKLLESYAYAVIDAIDQLYNPFRIEIQVKKPLALAHANYAIVELKRGASYALDLSHRCSEETGR